MYRKNVVLIKNKRNISLKKKQDITIFLRAFFIVSLTMICLVSLLIFSVKVDENSRSIGFGEGESAIGIFEKDTNYVMNFFSKKIEISKDKINNTINSAIDFAGCLINPVLRVLWQGIELIT